MEIINKIALLKLKKKNKGNVKLIKAIDKLIKDLSENDFNNEFELYRIRKDADLVHNNGFFFFDIAVHRTMILMLFEDKEVDVLWVGSHDDYERTYKNNKDVIEKWLKDKGYI